MDGDDYVEVEIDADPAQLVATGFAAADPDGVLRITPQGLKFLRAWLDRQGMS